MSYTRQTSAAGPIPKILHSSENAAANVFVIYCSSTLEQLLSDVRKAAKAGPVFHPTGYT